MAKNFFIGFYNFVMKISAIKFPQININSYKYNPAASMYSNLKPLAADTVSFTSAKLLAKDIAKCEVTEKNCRQVATDARPAYDYFKKVLFTYLTPLSKKTVHAGKKTQNAFDYYTGIKAPDSIKEKVVSKYSSIVKDDNDDFCNELTNELADKFKFSGQILKNEIRNDINKVMADIQKEQNIPPYKHIKHYFDEIIGYLEINNRFDRSTQNYQNRENIYKDIINKLEISAQDHDHIDGSGYIKPSTINGIKHYANDIIRGRIVLNDSNSKYLSEVLDAFEKAVSTGDIKIISVENKLPDAEKLPKGKHLSEYEYISENKLKEFCTNTGAKYIPETTKSGYIGIHLNLDLSNYQIEKKGKKYTGYQAEIQILGRDILKLKEVEDLCYKLKDSKNAGPKKYLNFRDNFLKHYQGAQVKIFNDYTYALYLAQRTQDMNDPKTSFPRPASLGIKGLSPMLEFNYLAKLKKDCEDATDAAFEFNIN